MHDNLTANRSLSMEVIVSFYSGLSIVSVSFDSGLSIISVSLTAILVYSNMLGLQDKDIHMNINNEYSFIDLLSCPFLVPTYSIRLFNL